MIDSELHFQNSKIFAQDEGQSVLIKLAASLIMLPINITTAILSGILHSISATSNQPGVQRLQSADRGDNDLLD